MLGLTLLVSSIALADSVNPSTVIPGAWLAAAPRMRRLLSFTLGAFLVYLAGGVVLVFGPGPVVISTLHHVRGPLEHALQFAGGVLALGFAVVLWRARPAPSAPAQGRRGHTSLSAFGLGAGIMAVELPTAFIYFGAISAILTNHTSPAFEMLLLVIYNAIFVAPLLAFAVVRRLAGQRGERWLDAAQPQLLRFGRVAISTLSGASGAALLTVGLAGLLAS